MTILLIDDHPGIQSLVKQHILAFAPNAEVIGCFNVNEAKQLFSSQTKIDFVISDLELVEGCNLDVLNICHHNRIPCMIYSSHVNKVLLNEAEKLRVNCYVSKQSDLSHLDKGLKALFTNKKYYCSIVQRMKESNTSFKETKKLILTSGQKKIVDLLAKGFTRLDAKEMLKIKLNTLNNQIARAREVNDCGNLEELIRRYKFWDNTD
jgi:DNA-binding NarL/FixJ family response regulator